MGDDRRRGSGPLVRDRKRKRDGRVVDDSNTNPLPRKIHKGFDYRRPLTLKEKAKQLFQVRKKLPIWPHADEIRKSLAERDVMLLVGETGSGKSTQVPQFLLEESWCRTQTVKNDEGQDCKIGGCIAITQPRRVAATSLARRVADEMGTPLGSSSPASKVGYSVRFDTSTSPSTRIKFLTEGMLLQELLRDPALKAYSAVIVDEVHERGVNVDLVLGFLRNLVVQRSKERKGVPLKVVVMSATADVDGLQKFFEEGYGKAKGGNVSVETEDNNEPLQKSDPHFISVCYIKGRQFPVKMNYTTEPVHDYLDAALNQVLEIHMKEALPGDVLVFLPGQESIETLEANLNRVANDLDQHAPKLLILPLFAALPQAAQQRIFQQTPFRTRKVIIATNIAETSVTVPGVRYVVDSGWCKLKQFRPQLGLDSLLVKGISKSSAIQRTGRAGREAPGKCYRLYTEKDFDKLKQANTPEILRSDLSQAILTMKARGIDDVWNFPLLDPPKREAVEKALLQLWRLGALTESGLISKIGLQMAKFPLSPSLSRILIAAATSESECLAEAIDIIACLSVENIFLNSQDEEKKEKMIEARRDLFRRGSDHLMLLATVEGYAAETQNKKVFAEQHFLSHRAMRSVMDVRKQLRAQCVQAKLTSSFNESDQNYLSSERSSAVLKCFLHAYHPFKTARLMPDGTYKTFIGNNTVLIHPSSVVFGMKAEAIMYNEYVFTSKSYARGVSVIELGWIRDLQQDTTNPKD